MTDYIIATSSTSDLPRTWLEAHGVPFISYTYTIGETVFEDDCREESRQKVYEGMRNGDFLKTAMINEFEYEEFFRSLMQEGRNVIFLDMSREMSSSYVNAGLAAESIREEFPDQTLYIMDTLCISGGLGLLVEQMVLRKEQGMGFEEVIAWGEENKLKIAHRFTVDDLNYLKAGGRVSNASALVGSLLNIKPVLYVPDKGTLDVVKKARGRKAALKSILDGVIHDLSESGAEGREIHILQADCREDAEKIRDGIKAAFPGVGNITITSLGVVIGAHCGPGLLTVFYLCSGRRPE
ncbi:MAG: DegV family protein [Oscillospiraceae bacterium]|nr:DegV family protein [Oscillospiraceae bacterium]MBQ6215669.1 DegV family protein [Oscillospiraceae bacterium]